MGSLDIIKSIGYILVLMLVFSPLIFLVANTFVAGTENVCYEKYSDPLPETISDKDREAHNSQMLECQESYHKEIAKEQTTIFIIVSILSIITLLVLLIAKNITPIISYGLFFGVSINIIRLVWGFDEANSFIAAGLGIILFVIALIFINKSMSNKPTTKDKLKYIIKKIRK